MVKLTVRSALRDGMAEELRRDPDVFLMGEEVAEYQGAYKVTRALLQEFGPKRIIDTPISEYGFTGIGVGAAFTGLKPIVEFMSFNFAMQAIDHIVNSAAKIHYMSDGEMRCPIVFRGPNGIATRLAAQHAQCFSSWYAHIPGLKVIAPYHAADFKGLIKAAIRDPSPVVFLENEMLYAHAHEVTEEELNSVSGDSAAEIGKAKVRQFGDNITIVSFSISVETALKAAKIMFSEYNISAEVIDLRTLRPLDIDTIIKSVQKTNRLLIIEGGWGFAGIGAEVAAQIMEKAFDYLDAPVQRLCGKEVPLPYAANLERIALVQIEEVVSVIKRLCNV